MKKSKLIRLPAIVYNANETNFEFDYRPSEMDFERMGMALTSAKEALESGDNPIGAVLSTPFGDFAAGTREFRDNDLEAHAEKLTYRAAKRAHNKQPRQESFGLHLGKCVLYSTAELCLGCSHLFDQAEIGMVIVAASRDDAPDFFRKKPITMDSIWQQSPRTLTVVKGLRSDEAIKLLTSQNKRH